LAHPHLSNELARFEARIQRHKNRLVAIPAEVQRNLALQRQPDNYLILASIRTSGVGRWNHHYLKLTGDNEFSIPSDVAHLNPGDEVEVKIHRIISDVPVSPKAASTQSAAGLLLELEKRPRPGWRHDGSLRLDEHLKEEIEDESRPG